MRSDSESYSRSLCARCDHPPGWHRPRAVIEDPTDNRARLPCSGYDDEGRACGCANYERWKRS
jgi:hypothetical protein